MSHPNQVRGRFAISTRFADECARMTAPGHHPSFTALATSTIERSWSRTIATEPRRNPTTSLQQVTAPGRLLAGHGPLHEVSVQQEDAPVILVGSPPHRRGTSAVISRSSTAGCSVSPPRLRGRPTVISRSSTVGYSGSPPHRRGRPTVISRSSTVGYSGSPPHRRGTSAVISRSSTAGYSGSPPRLRGRPTVISRSSTVGYSGSPPHRRGVLAVVG
jgi:hypothetical protein